MTRFCSMRLLLSILGFVLRLLKKRLYLFNAFRSLSFIVDAVKVILIVLCLYLIYHCPLDDQFSVTILNEILSFNDISIMTCSRLNAYIKLGFKCLIISKVEADCSKILLFVHNLLFE